MLDKEFHWYIDNQSELLKKYEGRVLVIQDENVIDDYDTYDNAYRNAVKKYELGKFLLMECTQGNEAYSETVYTPYYF
jgi:hypothetical protein